MDTYQAATQRRTIRRFKQDEIPADILRRLLNAARLAPSGANLQPLEYILVSDREVVSQVFQCLKWAGYIAPAGDPPEGKRPVAYVVVLLNRKIREAGGNHDAAAAIENMLLVAHAEGIGTCWIGSVDRVRLASILSIPSSHEIDSVVALGYPDQRSVVEEYKGSIKYWMDEAGIMHVPKRALKDIAHINKFGRKLPG